MFIPLDNVYGSDASNSLILLPCYLQFVVGRELPSTDNMKKVDFYSFCKLQIHSGHANNSTASLVILLVRKNETKFWTFLHPKF